MYNNRINSLIKREIDSQFQKSFRDSNLFTADTIERLHLAHEFKDHDGCVNCIEWNQEGTMLASGSDDLKIKLWDPFRRKLITTIDTQHHGNIFSVKYLPFTSDNVIASSAADSVIFVHDVNSKSILQEIHSHRNRVKRLEVANDTPFLFWSSGEDGFVLQHDIRCPSDKASRILISYSSCNNKNSNLEVKCLSINPMRTDYLAVGCNDPFARVYDRRMIETQTHKVAASSSEATSRTKCVHEYRQDLEKNLIKYYSPGHIQSNLQDYKRRMKYLSVTYLTFNQTGSELLVNLSGEQIYLFDVNKSFDFQYDSYKAIFRDLKADSENEINSKKKKSKLPDFVEELKSKANTYFENGYYYDAIRYYNKAIAKIPNSEVLYGNRAAALMKRNWDGDMYAAMRDCYSALNIDKNHMKSHFRLSRCLHELKWDADANECLKIFSSVYKEHSNTNAFETLLKDIEKVIKKNGGASTSSNKRSNLDTLVSNEEKCKSFKGVKSQHPADADISEEEEEEDEEEDEASVATISEENRAKLICEEYEKYLKSSVIDYKSYFSGHCNVATDIKEASFIGDKFIGAGSDDGSLYIWDRKSKNILNVFKADESIVNCVQPHPLTCMIATSGIDSSIKLWTPGNTPEIRLVNDVKGAAAKNQKQMNQNPVEFFFMNINNSLLNEEDEEDSDSNSERIACRTS